MRIDASGVVGRLVSSVPYLQRLCNHCTYPACLAACPRRAIYKRGEDGIVLIDQKRCRGYRKCVAACPYKKPMFRSTTRVSEKCIACYPRIEGKDALTQGEPMETRSMAACVGKIRMQGLVEIGADGAWVESRANPLYFLIKVEKVALPLHPQFGTEPTWYFLSLEQPVGIGTYLAPVAAVAGVFAAQLIGLRHLRGRAADREQGGTDPT
jgi:nitrate reductase beta subunit